MNKRIRLLAEQASEIDGDDHLYYNPEFAEKFAELIVRECAEIADVERPNSLGCGYITKTKGMLIKEHFGVKE